MNSLTSACSNIWTIARKELRTYFSSPIAYILIAAFLVIMGWMFNGILGYFAKAAAEASMYNSGKAPSMSAGLIRPLYGNMNLIYLFMIPFITMRLFAEEKKNQTFALLMTSPLTLTEIILGKFISSFLMVTLMLACTLFYPLILYWVGSPDTGTIVASIIGILLLNSCYLAIGILFSALTENQIVAATLTFATILFLWIVSWAASTAGPVLGALLQYLSVVGHFNNFNQGVLNTSDFVFYLSFIGIGLFITHRVLDSYRWR